MCQHAGDELVRDRREPAATGILLVGEQVLAASWSARDMLKCPPVPVRFDYGFGMTVTSQPCLRAISFIIIRHSVCRSAEAMASA